MATVIFAVVILAFLLWRYRTISWRANIGRFVAVLLVLLVIGIASVLMR